MSSNLELTKSLGIFDIDDLECGIPPAILQGLMDSRDISVKPLATIIDWWEKIIRRCSNNLLSFKRATIIPMSEYPSGIP